MKLEGLKVVDLSWFLPGPYLTTALADHGAEVIKVEPPGEGDPGRHIRPPDQRTSVFFRNMGRGKKSVVLDLKSEQGRADLFRSAPAPPTCWSNPSGPASRPRFGIGYEAVKARNPGIVYCSISAFGQDGAYPGRAAHDLALEAMTGVLSLTLGDDGRPAIPGIPVADLVSGLHGLSGVLMALLRRQTTGKGDYIDVSMHEALMASCANVVGTAFTEGKQPDVKQPAHDRRLGLLSRLRHVGRPPARAGRPGDEVHPQSAGRARQARDGGAVRMARARTRSR